MRSKWMIVIVGLVLVLVLAACGGDDNEDTATPSPSVTAVPTSTPLPPAWTPAPPGFIPSETPTPDEGELIGSGEGEQGDASANDAQTAEGDGGAAGAESDGSGLVLPPTWTPFTRPTVTPLPTSAELNPETLDSGTSSELPSPVPVGPSRTPMPESCNQFTSLTADQRTASGQPAVVSWTAMPEAAKYLVELRHPNGGVVFGTIIDGTTYEFDGELFETKGVYGWQVVPISDRDERACFPLTGEIIVS
ncbi:MAG: hypothetical protein JW966_09725 [Anaerolineae bacterium]|nr:hypothetical protein [Anaerolineae bacterium]